MPAQLIDFTCLSPEQQLIAQAYLINKILTPNSTPAQAIASTGWTPCLNPAKAEANITLALAKVANFTGNAAALATAAESAGWGCIPPAALRYRAAVFAAYLLYLTQPQ